MIRSLYKTKYFYEFINSQPKNIKAKINIGLLMLKTYDIIPANWVKLICNGIYELRIKFGSDIFRIFFIFDADKIVVLMNGFQKKTQKTPKNEIEKAKRIKDEYYEEKRKSR